MSDMEGGSALQHDFPVVIEYAASGRATPSQTIAVLINTAVGAGLLSLPFTFGRAGWAGGLLILAGVAAVECFTLYVLSRWAEATGAASYGELVHRALGPSASVLLALALLLYLFGSGVAYLVIIGDTVQPVLAHLSGDAAWATRSAVISGIGTAVVLPLCLPRTLSAVSAISTVNFVAFVLVIGAVLVRSMQIVAAAADPWADVHAFRPTFLAAVPIVVFGLQCHATVVAAFNEFSGDAAGGVLTLRQLLGFRGADEAANSGGDGGLQSEHLRRKSPKLVAMTRVIVAAIGVTACGYALVGISAYLAFPTTVSSNILNSFSPRDPLMQAARAVVGVLEIASYPVNHFPARAAVRELVAHATGRAVAGRAFEITETLVFFFATLALALKVTNLGAVFSLVGGTCGSLIILGIPGAVLVRYAWDKHQRSRQGLPLGRPLLGDEGGVDVAAAAGEEVPLYHAWRSKLFAAGVMLCAASAALISFTVAKLLTA